MLTIKDSGLLGITSFEVSNSTGELKVMTPVTIMSKGGLVLVALIVVSLELAHETQVLGKLFYIAQPHIRFCYQPGDQLNQQSAPISTQCVYCHKNQFDHTLFKCTGISAVQQYINTTQAFCIIAQCLEQIRNQHPVLLG